MNHADFISLTAVAAMVCIMPACAAPPGPAGEVTLERVGDQWTLHRDGKPYFINGAGGSAHLDLLTELGGNSIRTWGAQQLEPRQWPDGSTASVMDLAHEHGLTVTAGFWVQHLPGGFLDGYDYGDPDAVQRQLDDARAFAERWKDHPALLVWGVGNEATGADIEQSWREIDRVAAVFKEVDPHHPTMTVIPGVRREVVSRFRELCPNVDILGVNAYAGLRVVPEELAAAGYDGPYIVTEFGPHGHWETAKTEWGAEIEQTSTEKAAAYEAGYRAGVENQPNCLGSYVFKWGYKQERTDTWFSMFLPAGEKTGAVDVMAKIWSGQAPANLAPRVEPIVTPIARARVTPGSEAEASIKAHDPDGDELQYRWVVRRESHDKQPGGAPEAAPEEAPDLILKGQGEPAVSLRIPDQPGPYRLYVYVLDGAGSAATANVSFLVESD